MVDLLERRVVLRARQRALLNQLRKNQAAARGRSQTGGLAKHPSPGTARQLRRLQAALGRLADGSYGICMQCGGRISAKRLDEDPSTTLCASCKGEG